MCSINITTLEINLLAQHVSTQESHHQAEYLRTIKYIILYSTTHITIALGIPYALHCGNTLISDVVVLNEHIF